MCHSVPFHGFVVAIFLERQVGSHRPTKHVLWIARNQEDIKQTPEP
jgi:hypothetical protein